MKRITCVLITLALLVCLIGCSTTETKTTEAPNGKTTTQSTEAADGKTTTQSTEAADGKTTTQSTEAADPQSNVVMLDDFTVKTIDGGSFTLSEALKDHELVLVNIFATWCGPCGYEFPFLEEAIKQASDRVAVVALSIEPTDTDDVLKEYTEEMGMTFPVGHTEGTTLGDFVTEGIPTTIVVDRTGKVAAVEVGAMGSVQDFLDLFDEYTGENYNPNVCKYTVCAYDSEYEGVGGVTVNFCTDSMCTPVVTDEDGYAYFTGAPGRYHVQVIGTPEGLKVDGETECYTEPYGQILWVGLVPETAATEGGEG